MQENKPLTLKRLRRRHAENPQDADLHKIIESSNADGKKLEGLIAEATKHEAFDKKK